LVKNFIPQAAVLFSAVRALQLRSTPALRLSPVHALLPGRRDNDEDDEEEELKHQEEENEEDDDVYSDDMLPF
jgi:hypothetical protein